MLKTESILNELEIEIEKLKKVESENRKHFESEIAESQTKIKLLNDENLVLKSDFERCEITKNRCSDLLKENGDLKTEIQQLETILSNFSNGEKSLNMLLKNQFSVQNKHGLGFEKNNVFERRISNDLKNPSNNLEKNQFENLNSYNFKGFLSQNQNEKLFYNNPSKQSWIPKRNKPNFVKFKQIWVPKGTKVYSDGLLYKQVWVPKRTNTTVSGFTAFVRPLNPLNS